MGRGAFVHYLWTIASGMHYGKHCFVCIVLEIATAVYLCGLLSLHCADSTQLCSWLRVVVVHTAVFWVLCGMTSLVLLFVLHDIL